MASAQITKLKRKATELEQKKQFEKALALYIQVIDEAGRDLDDTDLQLFNRVGDLLTRQGNTSEALVYYEKAVDMYAERGFQNNAIALCNKILRQSPARTIVYYKLGKISASKGFKSDARKNFFEYADRMRKTGNQDEAFRALKEFADLCPDQDDVRLMLADLLTKENRTVEAIEQLEQLYARLEGEGRTAEAHATLSRIKAIDPELTLRGTGTYTAIKTNDLVYLDFGASEFPAPRAASPGPVTPVVPTEVVESIDVAGHRALEGLTITFLPDEAEAPVPAAVEPLPSLESLDPASRPDGDAVAPMANLVASLSPTLDEPLEAVAPDLERSDWAGEPDSEGIQADWPGATTDNDRSSNDDPEDSEAPGQRDIALGAAGMLDETPDEWVAAALQGARDDLSFDRLLTPFDNAAIRANGALPDVGQPEPPSGETAFEFAPISGSFSVDELQTLPVNDLEGLAIALSGPELEVVDSVVSSSAAACDPVTPDEAPTVVGGGCHDSVGGDEEPTETEEALLPEPVAPLASIDGPVVDDAVSDTFESQGGAIVADGPGLSADSAGSGRHYAPSPEFALAEGDDEEPAPGLSALELGDLRALVAPEPGAAEATESANQELKDSQLRDAFAEDRVELPLLDLESATLEEGKLETSFRLPETAINDLLASPPLFGDGAEEFGFEPGPLDLLSEGTTDEWSTPEVLIDGEWRDNHVGDLVSGEMFVVGERREVDGPPRSTFDDLAAALLYSGDEGHPRLPTPSSASAFRVDSGTTGNSLSFGGETAQLRKRLELRPDDTALRRQLGEALLDLGEREEGLNELEIAVREYEVHGNLALAGQAVDLILRVVPLSVRHHQKRVEYAVRASDRAMLVDAYTELAEALFRCGEPGKSRVVYSRVLELAPSNERARFAVSMLADEAGTPRSSDDVPVIDTGILSGSPSLTMAMLTPESLEESVPRAMLDFLNEPTAGDQRADAESDADSELDAEVNAAFADQEAVGAARNTSELVAVEEWAASQPPPVNPAVAAADDDYVDLGDWLRGSEPERSTRMVAADVTPTGDESADFAEMLRRFKHGLAANVDEDDYASHYDLGVAFKEMGLIDEAITEFQRSLRGADHLVRSYEALGHCFVEKEMYPVALALLRRAETTPGVDDQRLVGVLYLLGFASEAVGHLRDAVGYYQRVFAVDIAFRDVGPRLAALDRPGK